MARLMKELVRVVRQENESPLRAQCQQQEEPNAGDKAYELCFGRRFPFVSFPASGCGKKPARPVI